MSKAGLKLMLPAEVAQEIAQVAASAQRSTAFITLRALLAAPKDAVAEAGDTSFSLSLDEDDPTTTLTKIKATAGKRPLDQAVAGAWTQTRSRFAKWLEKESAARQAEDAGDLDAALAEAQAAGTSADRLAALARSEYPRVRALVAAHGATPAETLSALAKDREPYVREVVQRRG